MARPTARARSIRVSSSSTSRTAAFHQHHLADDQRYYKHANKSYLEWAKGAGFIGGADPIIFQLYLEPLQRFRLAARGHGAVQPPPSHRQRIETYFDPIPFWYRAVSHGRFGARAEFPLHAITQRPMHMYHSWGSQNAWLRQITAREPALRASRARAPRTASPTTIGCGYRARIGRVKCQVRLMDGVNPDTVWTWNAIGKRAGAWGARRGRAGDRARLPAQSSDRASCCPSARAAIASPTVIRSPGRPPGTIYASRSRSAPRARRRRASRDLNGWCSLSRG